MSTTGIMQNDDGRSGRLTLMGRRRVCPPARRRSGRSPPVREDGDGNLPDKVDGDTATLHDYPAGRGSMMIRLGRVLDRFDSGLRGLSGEAAG
jgi:hypothetical protein